jgi:hypothetical protein
VSSHRKEYVIYGLFDSRDGELRYVGQSRLGKNRFWEHVRTRELNKRTHTAYWLKGLIKSGGWPVWHIIQRFSDAAQLNAAEIYWISHFRSAGCRLTNYSDGGDCAHPVCWVMPQETRDRIAAKARGRKWSSEMRSKLSAIHKERLKDPVARAVVKASLAKATANAFTPEVRAKRSAVKRGKSRPEVAAKMQAYMADPVFRLAHGVRQIVDQNGVVYNSVSEAARRIGSAPANVSRSLHRGMRVAGRTFKFLEGA